MTKLNYESRLCDRHEGNTDHGANQSGCKRSVWKTNTRCLKQSIMRYQDTNTLCDGGEAPSSSPVNWA